MSTTLPVLSIGAILVATIFAWPTSSKPATTSSAAPGRASTTPPKFGVTIVSSSKQPTVFTGAVDRNGAPVTIACATCHATKTPDATTRQSSDLDLFHQGLEFEHGGLTCLACHDTSDYDRLKLASGRPVAFEDRQQLCEQCHGLKARDYANGAHGGMNGYWDLTRGARTKNACTHCHDPHAPKVSPMRRTFWTIDRLPANVKEERHGR